MSDDFQPEIIEEDGQIYVTTKHGQSVLIDPDRKFPDDNEVSLPEGFDATDPDSWLATMQEKDRVKRQLSMSVLTAMGYNTTTYVKWQPRSVRAFVLSEYAKRDLSGGEEEKPAPKAKASKAKTSKAKSAKSKAKASKPAEPTEEPAGEGVVIDMTPVMEALAALGERVTELQNQVVELREYAIETHYLASIQVRSNPDMEAMADELAEEMLGQTLFTGNAES